MAELIVDARGLSCPEPVLRTKKALDKKAEKLTILVDNPTAYGNVQRFLTKAGKTFKAEEKNGEYSIQVG